MNKIIWPCLVLIPGMLAAAPFEKSPAVTADRLSNDSINLDEVVVTGQGNSVQRCRLSSTFTKVSARDLAHAPLTRLDEALQDAIPNVQFSLTGGQPGSTSIIRSRGLSSAFANSTPVIYVDGVRIDNMNTGAHISFSQHGYSAEPYSTADLPMGQTAANGTLSDIPMENIDHIEYVPGGAATTLYGSDAANGVTGGTFHPGAVKYYKEIGVMR